MKQIIVDLRKIRIESDGYNDPFVDASGRIEVESTLMDYCGKIVKVTFTEVRKKARAIE